MSRWAVLVSLVGCLALFSCSRYTRVDYAGGWSVDCPAEFQHSWSNTLGPYAVLDIVNSSGSIRISVHGLNTPYPEVVDWANNEGTTYMKGSLATRGENLAVFEYKVPNPQTGVLEPHVWIVRDLGSLRTGIVEGRSNGTGQSATDELTRYCTQIANSMSATPEWRSDGKGGPGP